MCCKHNVLISLFCALLLSDVYIAGSPLIKQPLSSDGRQGREVRRCAPSFSLGKSEGLAGPKVGARRPPYPLGQDQAAEALRLGETAGPERPTEAEGRKGKGRKFLHPGN